MEKWDKFIAIMNDLIIPALGCTEPVAVALAVARCKALLDTKDEPESIIVLASRNIIKNAMGVGIPGTKFIGLKYAAALGAAGGDYTAGLEVFKNISFSDSETAKRYVEEKRISVKLKDVPDDLYIEVIYKIGCHEAHTIICGKHDRFTLIELDGKVLSTLSEQASNEISDKEYSVYDTTLEDIYDFITNVPIDRLEFIKNIISINTTISQEGTKNKYGLSLGLKMHELMASGIIGKDYCNNAIMRCTGAIDARMAGCTLPAMSNSGSGNQGITATIPVWSVAKDLNVSEEKMIRAVALSHIITIHIKAHMDKLSALCGAIIASTGASCGITYLFDGDFKKIETAIKNMIANLSGMICDGAKSSCSLKVASSIQACFYSAFLALGGICVNGTDGIIADTGDNTICNLAKLVKEGMKQTDRVILDIMTTKGEQEVNA